MDYVCSQVTVHNMPSNFWMDLVLMCTKDVTFALQTRPYRQIDGVAIGNPSSKGEKDFIF